MGAWAELSFGCSLFLNNRLKEESNINRHAWQVDKGGADTALLTFDRFKVSTLLIVSSNIYYY